MTSFIFYDNKKVQSRKESASGTAREATFEEKKNSEYKFSRPLGNNCAYLVILISGHSNEIRFRKNISPEGTVREFENIVGPHNVKPGLIFVHRVKNGLQHTHSHKHEQL